MQRTGATKKIAKFFTYTITDEDELLNIQEKLIELCGSESADYWENFIEMHIQWVEESEEY